MKSLQTREYYANKQNAFWRIAAEHLVNLPVEYAARVKRITSHGVAVWDVLAAATRSGSLDSAIEADAVPNNFRALLHAYPSIHRICFNGDKPRSLFRRFVVPTLSTEQQTIDSRVLLKAFLASVREPIRVNRSAKQETLINVLNPKIRGWANYHRHVVAKDTYAKVDHHIWLALSRWVRRRHPRKSARWVRRRYFRTQDHRHWVFATQDRGYTGTPRTLTLISASDTRIVRHVRIKSDANPFDPAWDSFFAHRQGLRMLERLQGRGYRGLCTSCAQRLP